MHTLESSTLLQRQSYYNNEYNCIIDKVEFLPGIIRVYIDERGDNSLGEIQDPMTSTLGVFRSGSLSETKNPINSGFYISNRSSQYCGYLDFSIDNSLLNGDNIIGFQYGAAGYSVAKLFRLNQELIEKYNIKSA